MRTHLEPDGLGSRAIRLDPQEALRLVDGYCDRLREQIDARNAGPDVAAAYGDAMDRRAALRELVPA